MKIKKRFLSILLSIALVLGMMPGMSLTAYAADITGPKDCSELNAGDVIKANATITRTGGQRFYLYINGNEIYINGSNQTVTVEGQYQVTGSYYGITSFTAYSDFIVSSNEPPSGQGTYYWLRLTSHTHNFTYSASGDTITATCTGVGTCGLTDKKATLTIAAPQHTTYGDGKEAAATLTGLQNFNTATSKTIAETDIKYFKATKGEGDTYIKGDEITTGAPTGAGDYLAEITLSGVKTSEGEGKSVAASVGYTIAPITISTAAVADITAPVATEALDTAATTSTEHVTLADSGAITWDPAAPQDGKAAYATEYTATVTATADDNYAFADGATATVNGETATVTKNDDGTLSIAYTFSKTALTPVTITATDKEVTYSADGIAIPVDGMFAITEGAGEATYSVTNGTGEGTFAEGKLTVTKCGTFTVKVSTAATETYAAGAETTATLTVNKADSTAATVTANNRTYDGTAQPLVTVTGETTGGTLKFAVTTENQEPAADAYNFDTTSIPAKTEAGTYYVWYKVIGDANHNDSDAKCIEASIAKATLTITADAKSKTAGEADPELTYTVKGLVDGDKLNGALSRVEGEEAGEYDIKQGTLSAGDNYSIVFTGAKLTIKEKKKITYTAYSGNGATWKKGSEEGLTLTFKRSEDDGTTIDHFTGITVAGKAVDKDKYSAVAGSVVITLKSEYLETLEEGEYLLAAQFDDGEDAEATFTIANADKTDDEVDEPEEEKADDAKVDEPEEEKADDAKVDEPEEEKADDAKIEEPEPEKPVQEAPADNIPKTSDNMNVPGVLFVMDLALLGMIVVMLLIGREKKKRR
jgi:VCBS repeat-containing protein